MKSNLKSNLFLAGALLYALAPAVYAQNERGNPRDSAPHMDEAFAHRATVPAGRVGRSFRKSPERFETPLRAASVEKGPGLMGRMARKEPAQFDGTVDPATSIVEVGSNDGFLELVDAETANQEHTGTARVSSVTAKAATFDPRAVLTSPANGSVLAGANNVAG